MIPESTQSDCVTPADLGDIATKDEVRLRTSVAQHGLIKNPLVDSIAGAFTTAWPKNNKRGVGPRICVKQGYQSFKTGYVASQNALKKAVTQIVAMDIRKQFFFNTRHRATATASGFSIDAGFWHTPTASPRWQDIVDATQFLAEQGKNIPFYDGTLFRVIGDGDLIKSLLRDRESREGNPGRPHPAFPGYPSYQWTEDVLTGIAFGEDERPFRAAEFTPEGAPRLEDPVKVSPAEGTYSVEDRPQWEFAPWGLFFIVAYPNFHRRVMKAHDTPKEFDKAPHLSVGIDWHYQLDSDCNIWGDFGWHKFQVSAEYTPVVPDNVMTVLYRRVIPDLSSQSETPTTN